MARKSGDELDLTVLRAHLQKKPRTKAGQIRQAWLKEIGLVIPYTRLSEYVNNLRRQDSSGVTALEARRDAAAALAQTASTESAPAAPKRDPLANLRKSQANRPGFQFRPARPEDEKHLV